MLIFSIQEMSLSNKVACEHAIKLIFVDSAGCGGVAFYSFMWFVATTFYTASLQVALRSGECWRINEVMVIMHSTGFKN